MAPKPLYLHSGIWNTIQKKKKQDRGKVHSSALTRLDIEWDLGHTQVQAERLCRYLDDALKALEVQMIWSTIHLDNANIIIMTTPSMKK